jgi:hypothetical protein
LTKALSSDKLSIIKINNRKIKMQTNNKLNLAEEMFKSADMINNVSRTGHLYGKLFAIKDMQIHLLEQEKEIKEQLEREDKDE